MLHHLALIPLLMAPIDCVRTFEGALPFIGTYEGQVTLMPREENGQWLGVECTHGEKKSPHLVGTHIESIRHVCGNARTISEVLSCNPHYTEPVSALHIMVTPELQTVLKVSEDGTILFSSGDTYALSSSIEAGVSEMIVTKSTLLKAFEGHDTRCDMLLLEFQGGENQIANWPYLTNEAAAEIEARGFSPLVLNIPSMDRESDGGRTSNHKIFFQDDNNLIVESADLHGSPLGPLSARLDLAPPEDPDCARCRHLYVTSSD